MTEFRQSGSCLTAWQESVPVAHLTWEVLDNGWYINFIFVEQPTLLVPLLSRFRRLWRLSNRPLIMFHTTPDNQAIGKLIVMLKAERKEDLYIIKDLG